MTSKLPKLVSVIGGSLISGDGTDIVDRLTRKAAQGVNVGFLDDIPA